MAYLKSTGLTNKVEYPAGHIVKVSTVTTGDTYTAVSGTHVWDDTVVTAAFTPTFADSSVVINASFSTYAHNTGAPSSQSNPGWAMRWERAISGGATSNPASITLGSNTSSNPQGYLAIEADGRLAAYNLVQSWTHSLMDTPATTSAITYMLQVASYNTVGTSKAGAINDTAWWHVWFAEVKR